MHLLGLKEKEEKKKKKESYSEEEDYSDEEEGSDVEYPTLFPYSATPFSSTPFSFGFSAKSSYITPPHLLGIIRCKECDVAGPDGHMCKPGDKHHICHACAKPFPNRDALESADKPTHCTYS